MRTLEERKQICADIPWVTRLKRPHQCTGWTSRASFTRGKYTCKHKAYWKYKHSKRSDFAPTPLVQYYCWNHLATRGLYGDMYEEKRTTKYFKKVGLIS